MRDIKYRAWDLQYKTLSQVTMILHMGNGEMEIDTIDNNGEPKYSTHFILEQFTGLKDTKGVELYEGDIIVFDFMPNKKIVYEYENCVPTYWSFIGVGLHEFTILGNIHENPELMDTK